MFEGLSTETKNLLRGLLDPKGDNQQIETLNRLRKKVPLSECRQVSGLLHDHLLFKHLKLPPEFPKVPSNFETHVRLARQPIENEITICSSRLRKHQEKINAALEDFYSLNCHLTEGNLNKALSEINKIENRVGCSFFLMVKLIYVYSQLEERSAEKELCATALSRYGLSANNIVALSIADTMGETYDLFSVRKNILGIGPRNGSNQFTLDLAKFVHLPCSYDVDNFHGRLQSFNQSSLFDGVIFAAIHHLNLEKTKQFNLNQDLFNEIEDIIGDTWGVISQEKVDFTKLIKGNYLEADYGFYRQSIAWIELAEVSRYRNSIDRYYHDQEVQFLINDPVGDAFLDNYFEDLNTLQQLLERRTPQTINLKKFDFDTSGIFSRTMGFVHLLEKTEGKLQIDPDDFMKLMGVTRDVANIANRKFLANIADQNPDDLISFVTKCLIARRSKKDADTFLLRRLIQEIVIKKFESNLLSFLKFIDKTSPVVADFVYEMCDEAFLSQLFRIFDDTDSFFECRADMHEWFGERINEPLLLERAKTLRIDLRLQKIRGEIDDTRVYVDPSRYSEWIQDNFFTELSGILRSQRITLFAYLVTDSGSELAQQQRPEVRMANLISNAFDEFCTNTKFGIASYLGRRIRHGTLKGAMLGPVQSLLDDPKFEDLLENDDSWKAVHRWIKNYRLGIDELGRDFLQINNNKKPKGLFDTDVFRKDRSDILRTAILDIDQTYADTKSFAHVNTKIYSYCWRLAERDLRRVREHLGNCRQAWGTFNAAEFRRSVPTELRGLAHTFTRELGTLLDDRFRTVTSWFKEPTNLSPSAPLNLLFDAVHAEVQETFPDFWPQTEFEKNSEIQLSGGTYHLLYDALYVVIYNAAKHGKKCGQLLCDFGLSQSSTGRKELVMTISSEVLPGATDAAVNANIKQAMEGSDDDALVVEGRSGFKKLARMQKDTKEMTGFNVICLDGRVRVTCKFGLVY